MSSSDVKSWRNTVANVRLRTTRRGKLITGMVLTLVGLGIPVTTGAAANVGPTWTVSVLPMPNGTTSSNPDPTLASTACVAVANCVMVGGYTDGNMHRDGLIVNVSGARTVSITAPLPADAATDPDVSLTSLACRSQAFCAAGGSYTDKNKAQQSLLEIFSQGTWNAVRAPLPRDAAASPVSATYSVSCVSSKYCVFVGTYVTTGGETVPFSETLDNGLLFPERDPLPADAAFDPVGPPRLVSVRCFGFSDCVSVGFYTNSTGGDFLPFADTLSQAGWTATVLPLPGGASPSNPLSAPVSMSCPARGFCVVVGQYADDNGSFQGLIEQLNGSVWTALKAPIPPGPIVGQDALFTSVSCPEVGRCAAAGDSTPTHGSQQGLLLRLSGGLWTPTVVPRPNPDDATSAVLSTVSCAAPDVCAAAGSSIFTGVLVTLRDRTLNAVQAAVPAPVVPEGPGFAPGSMACPSLNWCVTGGNFPKLLASGQTVHYGVIAVLSQPGRMHSP